jgi:uncharacterized protein (TIGR00725 family)
MRYTYPMSKNSLADLPIKICVSGARETSHCGLDALDMAEKIGGEIANHHCVLTGSAVAGFPMWAARGAKKAGGMTVGFSPASNLKEHAEVYRLPTDNLDMLVYTGFGYAGSDLLLMRSSDAIVFGCGRIGTIHEFTVAFQERKPIGILEGAWDTAELLKDIMARDIERPHDNIVFDKDPNRLIEQLIKLVKREREKEQK